MTRQMVMIGFLQAQNCTNLPCSWRHPESRDDAHSADYYKEIARVLEAGKFHIVAHVVPELQRRGLYQKDYTGVTLRENLGLPRPPVGAWKASQAAGKP